MNADAVVISLDDLHELLVLANETEHRTDDEHAALVRAARLYDVLRPGTDIACWVENSRDGEGEE